VSGAIEKYTRFRLGRLSLEWWPREYTAPGWMPWRPYSVDNFQRGRAFLLHWGRLTVSFQL